MVITRTVEMHAQLVGHVADHIRHLVVQNKAERVQGFERDGFPMFHPVEDVGGKPVLVDQLVFRDFLLFQRPVKGLVGYHGRPSP